MNRAAWLRFAFGVAVPIIALGAKAALDAAIQPQPWIVVTLFSITLASWISGPAYGALGTVIIIASELAGVPPVAAEPSPITRAAPALEIVTGIIAVLFGAVIRVTRVREQRSHETALRVSRASADLDRRWRIVRDAVSEFAEVNTVIQATDLLIRRVSELTGARHVDVVRAQGPGSTGELPRSPLRAGQSLLLPIVGESGPLSALRLDFGGRDADDVEDEDLAASVALARLCGAALDRIRLYTEGGSARHRASRSGERLDRLQRLTTALAAAVTPEAIGEAIVRHTLETLGASVGLFYVLESGGELRLAHARGYPIGLAGHDARLPRDVALPAVDAARTDEMVVVESPEAWRAAYPGTSDRLGITGTQSLVAVPIGHPATGVLVVQRATQDALSEDDVSFLDVVSHQATQALERSRLYAHEREARQLQEAFIGVMSHELRTPITTILAGSKLLSRATALDDRSRDLATDIEGEADRLFRLIEDLLVLSRLERGNLALIDEPVHLVRVVERVIASEAGRWPSTVFELPNEPEAYLVRGDETYIEQIMRNLLANAAKYSPEGSTVTVRIDGNDDEVSVRVLDEGPGVAVGEVENLFTLFYRSPTTAASAAGAGIGLFVCRRLIDAMGGHIWARVRKQGGSEFGFALAVYPTDDIDDVDATTAEASSPDDSFAVAPPVPQLVDGRNDITGVPIGRARP
jgi:signal transduction histidine kinase